MVRRPPKQSSQTCHTGQTDFADLLNLEAEATEQGQDRIAEEPSPALTYMPEFVPVFSVRLVRTGSLTYRERFPISGPRSIVSLLAEHLRDADREHFAIVLLDTKNKVIGVATTGIGLLSSALVHPREVFKAAILSNAASIVLAHNHPSGDPSPSPEDVAITRRLAESGELLGIEVLDHIVIGAEGQWVSLKEQGLCESRATYSVRSRFSR